jgi:hypothetical protein
MFRNKIRTEKEKETPHGDLMYPHMIWECMWKRVEKTAIKPRGPMFQ